MLFHMILYFECAINRKNVDNIVHCYWCLKNDVIAHVETQIKSSESTCIIYDTLKNLN